MTLHDVRFPNESDAYRTARDELLRAEMDLRKREEDVARMRRALPLGGAVREDYVFDGERGEVRLSQLFSPGRSTLVLYSYMYGPSMKNPCPMCTSMLDALEGNAHHIARVTDLAVVVKSPLERLQELAKTRGWRRFTLLSSAKTTYNRDYRGEDEKGSQWPSLNVFVKRDGVVHHFYNTELLFAPKEPGMDSRHIDMLWPLWKVLDLTPEGRGDFSPKIAY